MEVIACSKRTVQKKRHCQTIPLRRALEFYDILMMSPRGFKHQIWSIITVNIDSKNKILPIFLNSTLYCQHLSPSRRPTFCFWRVKWTRCHRWEVRVAGSTPCAWFPSPCRCALGAYSEGEQLDVFDFCRFFSCRCDMYEKNRKKVTGESQPRHGVCLTFFWIRSRAGSCW